MSKITRRLLLILLDFSLICMFLLFWLSYGAHVCFSPVGQVDNEPHAYGLYICSEGENINKSVDELGFFDGDIKSMISLMDSTKDVEQFINSGQFEAHDIEPSKIKSHIVNISKMWGDAKNKKSLFVLKSGTTKRLFLSSDYYGKGLIVQAKIEQNADGLNKLVLLSTRNEFSKLIGNWQALAGGLGQEMPATLNLFERFKVIMFVYNKFCRKEGYCLYYKNFSIADKSQDSEGSLVWEQFIKRIGSDSPLIIGSAMDSRSRKNIELDTDASVIGQRTKAMLSWLNKLSPVAYLYGDDFIAVFLEDRAGGGVSERSNQQIYLNKGSAPLFFVKKPDSEHYIAVDINTRNFFKNFIGEINLLESGAEL